MESADLQGNNSTNRLIRVVAILNLITFLPLQIIELVHTKTECQCACNTQCVQCTNFNSTMNDRDEYTCLIHWL